MANLQCVVHYPHISSASWSSILPLNIAKLQTLLANKKFREKLGGENAHIVQCEGIPAVDNLDSSIHGTHTECYKKFTKAKSILKKKGIAADDDNELESGKTPSKRIRRSGEGSKNFFPNHCMFCKSSQPRKITGQSKKQCIHIIEAEGAEAKIQQAAKDRNDEEMQVLVDGGKLYEQEFKCHSACYKEYTRPVYVPKETDTGNFPLVEKFVMKEIVGNRKAVSMVELMEIYGEDKNDRKKRQRLREKIEKVFPDILFLTANENSPQIVVSSLENITSSEFHMAQKQELVRFVASELRKDILNSIENAPPLPWPPKAADLLKEEREGPLSVKTFLRLLLQDSHHKTSEGTENHIWSFSQDLLHSISNGSFLTGKHVLTACAIHTLTGQKVAIELLALLGNCSSYYKELEIETAQAELCQHLAAANKPLPVQPTSLDESALTHFWWDNFDCNKENVKGSVHTTHGVAFQEVSSNTKFTTDDAQITPSGRRSLKVVGCALPPVNVNPKKPPKEFKKDDLDGTEISNKRFTDILTLWKLARRINEGKKQLIPRFVGHVIQIFKKQDAKTILTFLPPIIKPITEYSTVCETIHRSIRLSEFANMNYTHITVDLGAAEKYYKVIWNNQEEFKKVIIHLGDFHGMLHFFGNAGKFVCSSGFKDIVFQADMCSDGSIKKILSGKAYNSCWRIHEILAEAINRLFENAVSQLSLSKNLENKLKTVTDNHESTLNSSEFKKYMEKYSDLRNRCLSGEFGATAQFWMLYQKMIDLIHQVHYAVNVNDFSLRLYSWEELLKLSFVMNKQNYSRYGTYYTMQLRSIDKTHPGAREEIENKGISVCRNEYGIRQSIDGAGEQTFMRSSKTAGGIKNSVTQLATYERWVMSRPGQAEYVMALKEKLGYGRNSNMRKCLRSSEIEKHEKCVTKVMKILENDYINPFSSDLDKSKLFNLTSGKSVQEDVKDCLLTVFDRGEKRMEEFKNVLVGDDAEKNIFTPITREIWKGFEENNMKLKVKKDGKIKEIASQRDVLGILVAKSDQEKSSVNIEQALTAPLAMVSLPLACGDGGMRKTNKSSMYDFLLDLLGDVGTISNGDCYIIDLAASLRATVNLPKTFEELAMKMLSDVPRVYKIIYFACDTYDDASIKGSERANRGHSEELIVRSGKMKIPKDFQKFLNNGRNKERLFEIFEETYDMRKEDLNGREIYFARRNMCKRITSSSIESLYTMNHEEADTKVVSLVRHATEHTEQADAKFVVRSSSGDVDIPVIMLGSCLEGDIVIDSGRSNHRKILDMNKSTMTQQQKRALLGMHAFTGCDQNSSFFRKGKKICWKIAQNHLSAFCQLGESYEISDQLYKDLETFVCRLYGGKGDDVNRLRAEIFWKTLKKKGQVIDLSLLPPCRMSLHLHIRRSNYIARIWRQANTDMMEMEVPQEHGWNDDFSLQWPEEIIPEDVIREVDIDSEPNEESDYDTDSEDEVEDKDSDEADDEL